MAGRRVREPVRLQVGVGEVEQLQGGKRERKKERKL